MTYSEQMLHALENEELESADQLLNQALQHDSADVLAELAEQLQNLGFLAEAKKVYVKLIHDAPDQAIYYLPLAEIAIEDDDIDQAFDYLEKIPADSEHYPESLLVTADLYQVLGIPEVSEAKLLQAKALLPEEPMITFALAELHFSNNQLGEAIDEYGQLEKQGITELVGISLDERIGTAYSLMGGFEEAIPFLKQALAEEKTADRLFQLAFTYYQLHDAQNAITYFEELAALDPHYQSLYFYLATALKDEERIEEALTAAETGIKENPYQVELLHLASELAYRLHDRTLAENYLQDALAVGEKTDETRLTLSNLYLNEGEYEKAIDMIQQMDELDNPYAEWNLAQAYNELEDFEQAAKAFKAAAESLQHEPDFLKQYGLFLREDGKLTEARDVLTAYLALEPGDLEILSLLEDLN